MSENASGNQKLTTRQRRAIASLLRGENYEAAAMAAGVTPETVYRWRGLPEFTGELETQSQTAVKDATRQLTGSLTKCVDFLTSVIDDQEAPASVRVRAALGLIDRQLRMLEVTEVLTRLEALEARL